MWGFIFILFSQVQDQIKSEKTPECWNWLSNNGAFGGAGDFGTLSGITWPGGSGNHYLNMSRFVIGVKAGNKYFCTLTDYLMSNGEWEPYDTIYETNTRADHEMVTYFDDFKTNPRNWIGRHTGILVKIISLSYSFEPYNDFIGYELYITYDSTLTDLPGTPSYLDSLFVGFIYDFDISYNGPFNHSVDDLYSFDGWTFGEWNSMGYPYDSVTLLPDSFLNIPDGLWDQFLVWGDEPDEYTVHGDTYQIPRNIVFMYDGDNPSEPGDDTGENGLSEGYVGVKLIYAPKSSSDSIWIDNYGDTVRWICPASIQYFINDPSSDSSLYLYLKGKHPNTNYKRFALPPSITGDYKILLSTGPFTLYHRDTLHIVFGVAIGQELNGGYDSYYGRGWIRGLRQDADYLLKAYYSGSTNSDPLHPSSPPKDIHWLEIKEHFRFKNQKVKLFTVYRKNGVYLYSNKNIHAGLFDVSGRKIKELTIMPGKLKKLKGLKKGVYFIKHENQKYKVVIP